MRILRMKVDYVVDGTLRRAGEEFPCPPIWGDLNKRAGRAEWVTEVPAEAAQEDEPAEQATVDTNPPAAEPKFARTPRQTAKSAGKA